MCLDSILILIEAVECSSLFLYTNMGLIIWLIFFVPTPGGSWTSRHRVPDILSSPVIIISIYSPVKPITAVYIWVQLCHLSPNAEASFITYDPKIPVKINK